MPFPFDASGRNTKILWAVDAFHEKPREQLRAFEVVTKLFGKAPYSVQPVALLALGTYSAESVAFLEKWSDLANEAKKNLTKLLGSLKHPALRVPRFLQQQGHSAAAAARELLKHAVDEKVQLLVVSSQGRKGLDRALLGSFAESLVLQSPIPVLIVSPKSMAKTVPRLKTLLFPTDFSDPSRKAFDQIVDLAAAVGVPIVLFHKVQYLLPPVDPSFLYPILAPQGLPPESAKEFRDALKQTADQWISSAQAKGAKVKLHLDAKQGQPLDEIFRTAKKLGPSTLIAMASQSGPIESLVLGSLTRKVIRNASCPVLVVHPSDNSALKRFAEETIRLGYQYTARPLFT
jgi:nucleotide-binding universal stress UspA family protein